MAQKFSVASLMNDKSKAEKAAVPESRPVVTVPLDMIDPSPENKYSMDGIEELAASIELLGLLQYPLLRQKPNGRYAIIAGHRRRAALQLLVQDGKTEWENVPCTIIRTDNDVMAELKLLMANSTTRIMTDADKVFQASRIRELLISLKESGYKFGMRMREVVAQLMNTSPTNAGRYESIIKNLSAEWRQLFDKGDITITTAYELSRRDAAAQAASLEAYKATGTVKLAPVNDKKQTTERAPKLDGECVTITPIPNADAAACVDNVPIPVADAAAGAAAIPASDAAAIVADGMTNGIQSAAKIEAGRDAAPIVIHVVTATYKRLIDGATVIFEDYGSGKKVTTKLEVLE